MAQKPPTELEELIVRALTGRDDHARRALDQAAGADPEIAHFRDEMQTVVDLLTGAPDWRAGHPTAELSARIRQAVVERLPRAPQRFSEVLLEADLGRRRALWVWGLAACAGALALLLLAWFLLARWITPPPPKLTGDVAFATEFQPGALDAWTTPGGGHWATTKDGLRETSQAPQSALILTDSVVGSQPLACDFELILPQLDEATQAGVFLAPADQDALPTMDALDRPRQGLLLELKPGSLVLTCHGESHLLHSEKLDGEMRYVHVRFEWLLNRAVVTVNRRIIFDAPLPKTLHGRLHPGLRVSGPKKSAILFNSVKVER
jgi:hypothetical protein